MPEGLRHAHPLRRALLLAHEAGAALSANRLRSALTMLGMVIGVASVVLMVGIGEGSRLKVAQSMSQLGTQSLIVFSGSARSGGLRGAAGGLPTLTLDDAHAIRQLLSVADASAVHSVSAQVVWGGQNMASTITGAEVGYFGVANWSMAIGGSFSPAESRAAANVAVLGATVAKTLFGSTDPLGQVIRVQQQPFTVIGVLRPKGQSLMGTDQDDVVVVPVLTAQRKLRGNAFPGAVALISVAVRDAALMPTAVEEISSLLRQRHRIRPGQEDDFTVRDLGAVADVAASTSRILSLLLGSIAFISLLVGGIGIMNIMLVNVTERTREIGLRMALGGSRADLLGQFLLEAIFLSVVGGALGLLLGLGVGWALQALVGLSVSTSASAMLGAFGVASLVGVVFGYWPAAQASRLQPAEALRHA